MKKRQSGTWLAMYSAYSTRCNVGHTDLSILSEFAGQALYCSCTVASHNLTQVNLIMFLNSEVSCRSSLTLMYSVERCPVK